MRVCTTCARVREVLRKEELVQLLYGKHKFGHQRLHTGLVSLRQVGDTVKVSEIMPVTHVVEDVLDSVKKLKGSDLANEDFKELIW